MYFQDVFDIGVQVQNVYLLDIRKNQSLISYLKNIVLNEPSNYHTPILRSILYYLFSKKNYMKIFAAPE